MRSLDEILSALRAEVTEDGHILLDELENELLISYWPESVCEAAHLIFGDPVLNRDGRTYKLLDRRIRHCFRVWEDRHGPLTPEQRTYAADVIIAAMRRGESDAAGDRRKLYPFVQHKLGLAVNHEVVDAGFVRRGGLVKVTLDDI
jgi:hypothetical protein